MTDKRYQVFVSSTFADLTQERQEVMHALLELDCIPSGMELFPAADETQWELIKRIIDDCDYYILILAGRYGSLGPEGKSYTQMEYEYALSKSKPVIAFLHKEPGKIVAERTETTELGRQSLDLFRKAVEKRLCKMWSNPQELGSVVSRSLIQLIKHSPAVGWVRASDLVSADAAAEILNLRKKIDQLQTELEVSRVSGPKGSEEFAQHADKFEIQYKFAASTGDYDSEYFRSDLTTTWDDIFAVLAPMMMDEAEENVLKTTLNGWIGKREADGLINNKTNRIRSVRHFAIDEDDFQTIKIQFRALGLIKQSERTRSVKAQGTYWTLTPYGDQTMTRLRAVRRVNTPESDSAAPSSDAISETQAAAT